MYLLRTEDKIIKSQTLNGIKKKANLSLTKDDFVKVGKDYIAEISDLDYKILADKNEIERLAINKMFKPNPFSLSTVLQAVTLLMIIILLIRK